MLFIFGPFFIPMLVVSQHPFSLTLTLSNKIWFKVCAEVNGGYKKYQTEPVICGNIDVIKMLLKSIILFLRYILSINVGVIVAYNIFDIGLKCNKIQFNAGIKKWLLLL